MVDLHLSIYSPYDEIERIYKISGGLVVGGENREPIEN
jgi:hypothetical protein